MFAWQSVISLSQGLLDVPVRRLLPQGLQKKGTQPSSSTLRRAGNSMEYLRWWFLSRRLASMKLWRRRWTSAEKSGKMATLTFPKGILPFSLASLKAASWSLYLRNLAMNVWWVSSLGGGLAGMRCALSTTSVGEKASLP